MSKKSARHLAVILALVAAPSACSKSSPAAPTPAPCTFTLSKTSLTFGAAGGTDSVTVATASHCSWTAAFDRAWMTITTGATGTGNGVVTVSVTPNASIAVRTGALTIAGTVVPVQEDGLEPCWLDLSPSSASFTKDSGTGSFAVSAPAHCPWTAMTGAAWLTVTSGTPGAGNGTVAYAVERNRDVSARTGAIAIGERTFTVTQAGDSPAPADCEYSVTPVEFSPCMSVAYTLTATLTTQPGCVWTSASSAPWITMTGGQSGSGPGVVTFRVSDNWDAPRQGVVMVRWPTPTAGQNLQVAQAGCRYAVSVGTVTIGADGGAGRFDVLQQSDPTNCGGPLQNACLWTAQSDAAWITVTTPMPQVGDNPVSFTVARNDGATARTGSIAVRDKVVRISQNGR